MRSADRSQTRNNAAAENRDAVVPDIGLSTLVMQPILLPALSTLRIFARCLTYCVNAEEVA